MKITAAESSFRKGLRSLEGGRPLEALAFFEAGLRLERGTPDPARKATYASYYGYALATAMGRRKEGLEICRKAAESGFFTPEILLNLARVLIQNGKRKEAWETLMRGLMLDPDHAEMKSVVRKMGVRRRPPLPFLDRAHPLNRMVGLMTSGGRRILLGGPQKKMKTTSWWS